MSELAEMPEQGIGTFKSVGYTTEQVEALVIAAHRIVFPKSRHDPGAGDLMRLRTALQPFEGME